MCYQDSLKAQSRWCRFIGEPTDNVLHVFLEIFMITKTDDIIWRVVDDEALILNTSNGYYFSMNGTATEIWCLLNEGKSIADAAQTIAERYEIDIDSAREDVEALLQELKNEHIVE